MATPDSPRPFPGGQVPFVLFGAGPRPKLALTLSGVLDLGSGASIVAARLPGSAITFDPNRIAATLETADGPITVAEDGDTLRVDGPGLPAGGRVLSGEPVRLPLFADHRDGFLLRWLHHEVVVNILGGKPLPNILVYDRPWHRDAAMMAMVLAESGNLPLIRDWAVNLADPYDRNNAGHEEPDNIGQVLYLLAVLGEGGHPMVAKLLAEAGRRSGSGVLRGMTDFALHPVYQTQWLKFALARLGLADAWATPREPDSYAVLCWWMKDGIERPAKRFFPSEAKYPYLTWAESHFLGETPPMGLLGSIPPLTWEVEASEANYPGMSVVSPAFAQAKASLPHTWHAAEAFLYLLKQA